MDRHDVKRDRDARRHEMDKHAIWPARILFGIMLACVATMLIGLSLVVPWLGLPLTILAVIGWFFF